VLPRALWQHLATLLRFRSRSSFAQEKVSGKREELLERLFKILGSEGQAKPTSSKAVGAPATPALAGNCRPEALPGSSGPTPTALPESPSEPALDAIPLPIGSSELPAADTLTSPSLDVPIAEFDSQPSCQRSAASLTPMRFESDQVAGTNLPNKPVQAAQTTKATLATSSSDTPTSTQAALQPKADRAPRKPPTFSLWLQQPSALILKEARRLLVTSPDDLRALKVHELKLLLQLKELKVRACAIGAQCSTILS
jgi:hypothetical protein